MTTFASCALFGFPTNVFFVYDLIMYIFMVKLN